MSVITTDVVERCRPAVSRRISKSPEAYNLISKMYVSMLTNECLQCFSKMTLSRLKNMHYVK